MLKLNGASHRVLTQYVPKKPLKNRIYSLLYIRFLHKLCQNPVEPRVNLNPIKITTQDKRNTDVYTNH